MAFGAIEITTVTRAQDYTTIKHNEDNKPATDQVNIGNTVQKQEARRPKEVHSSDDSDWQNKKFDARDKSQNEYEGDGGRKRREKKTQQVIVNGHRGFDIKI